MKIKISKKNLLEATQTIQGVVSTKSTLPILSNMLIEAQKERMRLVATDLDIAMVCTTIAEVAQEGSITVPAKRFTDIIKELPDQDVTLTLKKNNLITIDCENAHFKVNCIPKDEFPKLPNYKNTEQITMDQQTLKQMLNMTSFAISHDETRYILNGVLFEIKKEKINLVATDGRRLAFISKELEAKQEKERNVIVPAKTINELNKTLKEGELKIYLGENQLTFDMGDVVVISRLIEGEFPNYEQVIPKEEKEKVLIEKEKFLAATRRANLLTSQDSQAVKFDIFKNRVVVSKNTPEIGEAREELDAEYKGNDITVGFNPNYLIDVLKTVDVEKVGFEITASDKPGVIRIADNFVYVVLPMQLG